MSFRLRILFKDYSSNFIWGLLSSLAIPLNILLLPFGISSENAVVFETPLILFSLKLSLLYLTGRMSMCRRRSCVVLGAAQ